MTERKTAGALSLKAAADKVKYDPLELAYALTDDIIEQLWICANRHKDIFGEDEYFLTLNIASDPLIAGIRRHKYAAWLYMPSPRPEQSCFLYNKITNKIKRLWTLPKAETMALLSEESPYKVSKAWKQTKGWVDAFYKLKFWEYIRKEHEISHLSEHEYLKANRDKLVQAGAKECDPGFTEPFDFSKVKIDHIIDTKTARVE